MKKIFTILFFLSLGLVFSAKAQAAPVYPVAELGSCRDAQECRLYCEVPENKPACWSYQRYVLQQGVLGDQATNSAEIARKHSTTFPVAELGNCASAQECKAYCDKVKNRTACFAFATKRGMLKQKQEQGLQEKEGILIYAKQELGCSDQNSCRQLCEDPVNREKCMQFAKKRGLGRDQKAEMQKERMSSSSALMSAIQEKLGCTSKETCYALCSKPENMQKCKEVMGQLNMQVSKPSGEEWRMKAASGAALRTCATGKECYEVCKADPSKCPGFMKPNENSGKMPLPTSYKHDPFELNPSSFSPSPTPAI